MTVRKKSQIRTKAKAKPRIHRSAKTGRDDLMGRVISILEQARSQVVKSVNSNMVLAYWLIGREIVQAAQQGQDRADYGDQILAGLSATLTVRYGRGYSQSNLAYFRQFYQVFAHRRPVIRDEKTAIPKIFHTVCGKSAVATKDDSAGIDLDGFSANLSWSHYRTLSGIEHALERTFYEIEAEQNTWSQRELERQIDSHLFARLLKSRDKKGLLKLARQGQVIVNPVDVIKHPYVLDFLGLPESHHLNESELETALIERLQPFLLELGKGFAFVARQQRIETQLRHFYIDLVFYNYLLKCFVLIDLKMGKLSHQDVGQMDMYVRMYDELKRAEGDNPTVGLILCTQRDEVVVRYSVLHESQQLFASKYLLYLPSEAELRTELERERDAIKRLRLHRDANT